MFIYLLSQVRIFLCPYLVRGDVRRRHSLCEPISKLVLHPCLPGYSLHRPATLQLRRGAKPNDSAIDVHVTFENALYLKSPARPAAVHSFDDRLKSTPFPSLQPFPQINHNQFLSRLYMMRTHRTALQIWQQLHFQFRFTNYLSCS